MALRRKCPRKGLKGLKGLKDKKGGDFPPFFKGKKTPPAGGFGAARLRPSGRAA